MSIIPSFHTGRLSSLRTFTSMLASAIRWVRWSSNPPTLPSTWNRVGIGVLLVLSMWIPAGPLASQQDASATVDAEEHSGPFPNWRYLGLRNALDDLEAVERNGGWEAVPGGENLQLGSQDPRVLPLRVRLVASGDLERREYLEVDPEIFDETLDEAVRRFQERHGLAVDGVVGRGTLAALNVSVEDRIDQVLLNLERMRRLPDDLGDRYFLINPAAFAVEMFEHGERIRWFPAIAGRPDRQTPDFSAEMSYLVLAPYWHVPPGIARRDLLPEIREDPDYVGERNMVLLDASRNRTIDPHSIDWAEITDSEFNRRYRLRQDPGPSNALGNVKFMFPNSHNVYMHDTPSQQLFAANVRAFSSGCIRVQGALGLAVYLLRDNSEWTPDRIREVVERGVERSVSLPSNYQVHVRYATAWVDVHGVLQLRDDVYDRDPALRRTLPESEPRT